MVFSDVANFLAWAHTLGSGWGYFGIFLTSLVGNATVFFPVLPTTLAIATFGALLNPWLIGFFAGLGGAIGELIGYAIGRGGREVLKEKKWLRKAEKWTKKRGFFLVVFIFAATPLPDDVTGILGGVLGYNIQKFFLACLLGKIFLYTLIAWAGYLGINFLLDIFIGT